MSWASDLKKLCDKGGHDLGRLSRAVKMELFSGVVRDTRVDTGRLRGNWQTQDGSPASGQLERTDKSGAIVMAEIERGATEDGVTFFTNNLPYARVYEEKDAMIGRNAARVRQLIKAEAAKLR